MIVLDASDPELARIAEPIYRAAVERSEELSARRFLSAAKRSRPQAITSR